MKEIISLLFVACICFSCVDNERNLSEEKESGNDLDLTFDFHLKSKKSLTITAENLSGKLAAGVPFNVYVENPYTDGDRLKDVKPVFTGITDASGSITADMLLPNEVKTIYVSTTYPGYGAMQTCEAANSASLAFGGVNPFVIKETETRGGSENNGEITRKSKICYPGTDNPYQLYTYYAQGIHATLASGLFKDGVSVDPELFSAEDITKISTVVNNMFPERVAVSDEKYFSADYCTDLQITEPVVNDGGVYQGTEIWVTFLGDGGFSDGNWNIFNALCYYTYDSAKGVTAQDAAGIRKTMLFPNTNVAKLSSVHAPVVGAKIQLMYWDEARQLYTNIFPAGVSIGWVMVAAQPGQNGAGDAMKNLGNYRFSTPVLNSNSAMPYPGAYTNGIARWSEDAGCNIVGLDYRLHKDPNEFNDMDYNDILIKVESNPMIKPKDEIPVPPVEDTAYKYSVFGTLAFEDNWPSKGDYDFNDFVTDYTYTIVKKTDAEGQLTNEVSAIELTFTPRAQGAVYTSGFGIQLPIATSNVDVSAMSGGILESANTQATVIVYDDIRQSAFNSVSGGFVNTVVGGNTAPGVPVKVRIPLKQAIADTGNLFSEFNPFIYVSNRGKEIHLTDMPPTDKVDMKWFGLNSDRSDPEHGVYYRMDNEFPWVLDIPRLRENTDAWIYPVENKEITLAYPKYESWLKDHSILWQKEPNEEFVYKP